MSGRTGVMCEYVKLVTRDSELWKTQKCVEMSCGVTAIGDGELWLTPCKLVRYEVTCERSLENDKNKRVSVGDGRSW